MACTPVHVFSLPQGRKGSNKDPSDVTAALGCTSSSSLLASVTALS
eukprot:CAMPEP_0173387718 /NCGR_PEP_ID=MMETSP1356-20130122/10173_1 /TAXON_ID=77927 ORGANISM="Hemiselmis virescens, Strain PCC157" /NCGR_SAMPLE_ID=MMETSP1356 /ASSEMBLY_ACC=CAM_ASM_000847 /LENGTH=45 /DNA_ID= /DNA_START= /DNA_END= /DNA_ORIENTATION=